MSPQQAFVVELKAMERMPLYQDIMALYGFGKNVILRIAGYYRDEDPKAQTLSDGLYHVGAILDKKPYTLAQAPGVSFNKLDMALTKLPKDHKWYMAPNDFRRLGGFVLNDFINARKQGASIIKADIYRSLLKDHFVQMVNATPANELSKDLQLQYADALKNNDFAVHVDYDELGHPIDGYMEKSYYQMINRLTNKIKLLYDTQTDGNHNTTIDEDLFKLAVEHNAFLNDDGTSELLADERQDIVRQLIEKPVSVLTGYAGTGKTSLLRILIDYLNMQSASTQLCAFSGKAAYNLYEHTYQPAETIDMVLIKHQNGVRLNVQYLIIDEISMVSESKLNALLKIIPATTHVIMLGDAAQLPAVGDVGVMTSLPWYLQQHDAIAHFNLTVQHRNQGNLLATANRLRQGKYPIDYQKHDDTLSYAQISSIEALAPLYVKTANAKGLDNTIMLASTNPDVTRLNAAIQTVFRRQNQLTPNDKVDIGVNGTLRTFFVGDRVLVTTNMYGRMLAKASPQYEPGLIQEKSEMVNTRDLFNGFIGMVEKIIHSPQYGDGVLLRFPDLDINTQTGETQDYYFEFFKKPFSPAQAKKVKFGFLDHLQLGYALTIHKAQGSTIPYTILYLGAPNAYSSLQSMQLLYTAYTRAKHLAVVSTEPINDTLLSGYLSSNCYDNMTSNLAYELDQTLTEE